MSIKESKILVAIEPIRLDTIQIPIRGTATLVMDRFTEEAKNQIVTKETGVSKSNKKRTRDLKKETLDAIHYTSTGCIGFPVAGFKKGMMECTSFVGDKSFSKKLVSGAVRIVNGDNGCVPIKFKKQDVWVHNIGNHIKFSPQFHDWSCVLEIQYDKNNISAQDITTLLNYAGFYVGIGMDRPKGKMGGSGCHGTYEVVKGKRGV